MEKISYKKPLIYLILLLIVSVGALFRFHQLGAKSLWLDEIGTWNTANSSSYTGVLRAVIEHDNHPPVFFFIEHAVIRNLGDSEFLLRMPSAVFGTLSVLLIFFLGKTLFGYREGLVSSALLAVSWFAVQCSREARNYGMLLFAVLGTALFLILFLRKLTARDLAGNSYLLTASAYVIFCTLALYSHHMSIYAMPVFLLWSYAFILNNFKPALDNAQLPQAQGSNALKLITAAHLSVFILYLPCLALFIRQYIYLRWKIAWLPSHSPQDFGIFVSLHNNLFQSPKFWTYTGLFALLFVFVKTIVTAIKKRNSASGELFLFLWLLLPPALTYLTSKYILPVYQPRYLVFVAPAAYLLTARAVTQVFRKDVLILLAALVSVYYLSQDFYHGRNEYSNISFNQFKEASLFVMEDKNIALSRSVIACSGYGTEFVKYYFRNIGAGPKAPDVSFVSIYDQPRIRQLLNAQAGKPFWFISYFFDFNKDGCLKQLLADDYAELLNAQFNAVNIKLLKKQSNPRKLITPRL